jgi:hypothetical protein
MCELPDVSRSCLLLFRLLRGSMRIFHVWHHLTNLEVFTVSIVFGWFLPSSRPYFSVIHLRARPVAVIRTKRLHYPETHTESAAPVRLVQWLGMTPPTS